MHSRNTAMPKFNDFLEDNILVHFIYHDWRSGLANIEHLITSQRITVKRPSSALYEIPSFHRVLVTTKVLSPILVLSTVFQQLFDVIRFRGAGPHCDSFYAAMQDPDKMTEFCRHLRERHVPRNI